MAGRRTDSGPESNPARMTERGLPAWSEAFAGSARTRLLRDRPFGTIDRDTIFGDSDGHGVTVAIIDSGVEVDHPALGGRVVRSLRVDPGLNEPRVVDDPGATDLVGHGTACAGIIHGIAPAAALVSIRVLGADNRAGGPAFAAALEWAIEEGFGVINLSLSSRSEAMAERFHELADQAYFANTLLVAAANNVVGASYPSLFAAVVSVAAHDAGDPDIWYYNPAPPVEFGAHGLDVDVAWRGGTRIRATGNSFAAPHLAGRAALIRSRHPDASPFEVKAMLAATASEPRP